MEYFSDKPQQVTSLALTTNSVRKCVYPPNQLRRKDSIYIPKGKERFRYEMSRISH